MAFKATNIVLSRAYDEIKREAVRAKNSATSVRTSAAAGSISAASILALAADLRSARINMEARASAPGVGQYAKDQEDDATYDVSAEYIAMRDGIDSVLAWISTNMPSNGGYLQVQTLEADGSLTQRSFAAGQTAGLRTAITALEALIS